MMESKGLWNLLESCIGVLIVGQILSVWIGTNIVVSHQTLEKSGPLVGSSEIVRNQIHMQKYYSGAQLYANFMFNFEDKEQSNGIEFYWSECSQIITQEELLSRISMDSYYQLEYKLNEQNAIKSICITEQNTDE